MALNFLEEKLQKKEHFSKEMILKVQAIIEKGASKEKVGLRGPMPPGVLFAVYDSETGVPQDLCLDIFLITMVMVLMGSALWKNTFYC